MNIQTQKTSGRKQPKQRRSLKKRSFAQGIDASQGLVIDMDKGELENIFTGLATGQLENPQAALSRLYGLALDSLAKTLVDSLDDACAHLSTNDTAHEIAGGTPFEPMLRNILPSDPGKIAAFKNSLSQKINEAKDRVTAAYDAAAHEGPDRVSEQSRRTGAEIQSLLHAFSDESQKTRAAHPLPPERLSQIYDQIHTPVYESGPRKYTISSLPNAWRFAIGNNKATVRSDSPGSVTISTAIDTKDAADGHTVVSATSDVTSNTAVNDISDQPQNEETPDHTVAAQDLTDTPQAETAQTEIAAENQPLPEKRLFKTSDLPFPQELVPQEVADAVPEVAPEIIDAIKSGATDIFAVANEVTSALETMALEIAHAAMAAYQEDETLQRSLPSLAERLQEASDIPQDEELLSFVQSLEAPEAPDAPADDEALSNDELADAFGQLLAQLDFDL